MNHTSRIPGFFKRPLSERAALVAEWAQNFAAIRALATEGIQQHGHMRLHAHQIAVAAGATSDLFARVVQQIIDKNNIRLERAQAIVDALEGDRA